MRGRPVDIGVTTDEKIRIMAEMNCQTDRTSTHEIALDPVSSDEFFKELPFHREGGFSMMLNKLTHTPFSQFTIDDWTETPLFKMTIDG